MSDESARRLRPRDLATGAPAAVLGLGLGLSQFFHGFYDRSTWGWMLVGVGVVLVVLLAWGGTRLTKRGAIAVAGLAGLALWAWISRGWTDSAESAAIDAERWALYASTLAVLLLLPRGRHARRLILYGAGAGLAIAGGYLCVRLVDSSSADLFFNGRLQDPLGYSNGQASYLLVGALLLIGGGEGARRGLAAGLAAAGAVVLLGLAVLAQSRGAVVSAIVAALVMLAGFPGRQRRAWLLLVTFAGVAVATPSLLDVSQARGAIRFISTDNARSALAVLFAVAVAVGGIWGGATEARRILRRRRSSVRKTADRVSAGLLVLVVLLATGAVIVRWGAIRSEVHNQYEAFVSLNSKSATDPSRSRLLSGGGHRYDYWRIAIRAWRDHPLAGVGSGSYDVSYYRLRQTGEAIRQPHSIELQAMAELGLVGLVLTLLFVVPGFTVLRVRRRRGERYGVRVAALGAFVAWLAQTSVDWMHLLPGLTGVALAALALLVEPTRRIEPSTSARALRLRTSVSAGARIAVIVLLAFTGVTTIRHTLAQHRRTEARAELATDPRATLRHVRDSFRLDDDSVAAYQLGSAAYARLGDYPAARTTLNAALSREPTDWVTWALLGDLATRRGDEGLARKAYGRAHRLNPRQPELVVPPQAP